MTDLRTPRLVALVVAALVVASVGCTRTTVDDASDPTIPPSGASTAVPPLEWHSCASGFVCATIEVPVDHDRPDGDALALELIKKPAERPGARIGSLLMNPGGPGAPGIDFVQGAPVTDEVADAFDLVSWDPRGIGQSSPLACESAEDAEAFRQLDSDPDDPDEQAELEAAARAIAEDCRASDLALLENMSVTDTAKDLEQIRIALGEPSLNYLGFSYGTLIGQEYARLYPATVRAMVLDGVVDPSETIQQLLRGQAETIEDTFSATTLDRFDELMVLAEREPLDGSSDTQVGPATITLAAVAASYFPDGERYLDQAITAALRGDTRAVEQLAAAYAGQTSFVAYLATTCTDSPFPPGIDEWNAFAAELRAAAPRFGAPVANELLSCAYWPVSSQRTPEPLTTAGLPPILVIGTTGDAATPYDDAARVAEDLPGAVLLTFDGEGHTAAGKSGCVGDAVTEYLVELQTPPPGTVCEPD